MYPRMGFLQFQFPTKRIAKRLYYESAFVPVLNRCRLMFAGRTTLAATASELSVPRIKLISCTDGGLQYAYAMALWRSTTKMRRPSLLQPPPTTLMRSDGINWRKVNAAASLTHTNTNTPTQWCYSANANAEQRTRSSQSYHVQILYLFGEYIIICLWKWMVL